MKLESPLEEEIKEQEKIYYKRLEKQLNRKGEMKAVDKEAVKEICGFKAVEKLFRLSKEKKMED